MGVIFNQGNSETLLAKECECQLYLQTAFANLINKHCFHKSNTDQRYASQTNLFFSLCPANLPQMEVLGFSCLYTQHMEEHQVQGALWIADLLGLGSPDAGSKCLSYKLPLDINIRKTFEPCINTS